MTQRAVVIGAGPAGLASAACLKRAGLNVEILEKSGSVGQSWRNHYGRLHLHTARNRSALPHLPMPEHFGRYPSRLDMVEYLETYARHFRLTPQFGTSVEELRPDGTGWRVAHSRGATWADHVVVAIGLNHTPFRAQLPGLETFSGEVLHSSDYHDPSGLAGDRVMVVGFGNSGGEIALDLAEAGANVTLSVRGPVNILPKEMFGLPTTSLGLLRKLFGYRIADRLTAPLLRAKIGRPADYGLPDPGKGPIAQVVEDGRIPLIDIGTLGAIRAGKIMTRPGIRTIDGARVWFTDGQSTDLDRIVLATGYRLDLRDLLPENLDLLDEHGRPRQTGAKTGARGLYFCSLKASPEGQLRQSGMDAEAIAAEAVARAA